MVIGLLFPKQQPSLIVIAEMQFFLIRILLLNAPDLEANVIWLSRPVTRQHHEQLV